MVACAFLVLGTGSCERSPTSASPADEGPGELFCDIDVRDIVLGAAKDAIPALSDPPLVSADDPSAGYLRDRFRVIGLRLGATYVAVPHNILWWHEVVNLDFPDVQLAVTYCPLTGSGLVFDRGSVLGAELGVSGFLLNNNLILYDRRAGSSLYPQMMRRGACGPDTGAQLIEYPAVEMTWAAWKRLHPETLVVSDQTGYSRGYTRYPYGNYESLADSATLFPMDIDTTRPPKERVLGIPDEDGGGIAFPFGELAEAGEDWATLEHDIGGTPVVVLWDGQAQAAAAFHRSFDGDWLDLVPSDVGGFTDLQTGSVWTVDGEAVQGPLAGSHLRPVDSAYVAFWFAWAAFQPNTEIWPSLTGIDGE